MIKAQKWIKNCTFLINKSLMIHVCFLNYHFYADNIQLGYSFYEFEECKLSGLLNCLAALEDGQ